MRIGSSASMITWFGSTTAEAANERGSRKRDCPAKITDQKSCSHNLLALRLTDIEDHLFYGPIRQLPETFSEEDKMRLTAAYTSMIEDKVKPAYLQIHDFMKGEYMEAGRLSSGFDVYPFGEDYYDYAIQLYTTTSMSADEIHELGLNEVARLRSEMEKVKKQVGFSWRFKCLFRSCENPTPTCTLRRSAASDRQLQCDS